MILVAIYLFAYFQLSVSLGPHEITFLIRSQNNAYNRRYAEELKEDILQQSLGLKSPQIYLTHETFNTGSWAITPWLLAENVGKILTAETKWLIICEDQSGVDLKALIENLSEEDFNAEAFLGYPLMDKEATIIHHFAFFEDPSRFLYPLLKAGLAITIPLINRLLERLNNEKFSTEFFIDASHEFSMFIFNNGKGHKLTSASYFCRERKTGCAIYSKPYATCNKQVPIENILFAVKTCSKFHLERIPIIKSTWSKDTTHIRFYSDIEDSSIPTINTHIPNTETGHCDKALSIFGLIVEEIQLNISLMSIEWIVFSDDDTLMSVTELRKILGCYNPHVDHIYLGERYGYRLLSPDGFNYITGGGGIIFSVNTLIKLINKCSCPMNTAPDDMIIGVCLKQLLIEPIHSDRFHQARPSDYSEELLTDPPISFHKFWQIDPYEVYKWFQNFSKDENVGSTNSTCKNCHEVKNDVFKISSTNKHVDL